MRGQNDLIRGVLAAYRRREGPPTRGHARNGLCRSEMARVICSAAVGIAAKGGTYGLASRGECRATAGWSPMPCDPLARPIAGTGMCVYAAG